MEAILFAFVAHIGWGTSDIFGAMVSRKIGGYSTTFWGYVVRIPVLALYIPFDLEHVQALTWGNVAVSGLLATVLLVGTSCFFEAFRGGNASLVGTISSAFTVPTVILSILFFNERVDLYQTLAIVVIVVGLIFTSLDFGSFRQKSVGMDRSVVLALLAMLFWGVYFAFIRIPVEEIGWFLPAYISFLFSPLVLVIMRMQGITLQSPAAHRVLPSFIGMILLGTAANFGYNLGISSGYTSIVAPIAGAYPVLFVTLSALVFKDPLKQQQLWGIVVSLAGIVALSLLS
jgi:drug/metabolite transporter (DMT)-like permease